MKLTKLGRCFSPIVVFSFLAAPPCATAQYAEFLTPLTESEGATVRLENDYFLKKHLYAAKRHRLVRANVDLLKSGTPFVISLFEDESLVVEPTEFVVRGDGSILIWKGTISNPPISVNELMSTFPSEKEAQLAHSALFGISIGAARYEHDVQSGANFTLAPLPNDAELSIESQKAHPDNQIFYGVTAKFLILPTSREYMLLPLEMGGAHHIVYEIDRSRVVEPGPLRDPENPDQAQKRRELQEYIDSLGEDPRIEVLRQREQQQ